MTGVLGALLLAFSLQGGMTKAPVVAPLEVRDGERLLVVAPHPDDETIGTGGLIQRVLERGGSVRVALVTAGDGYVEAVVHETKEPRPRPTEFIAYGERRMSEARAAMRVLDNNRIRLQLLGFPDGGLTWLLRAYRPRSHPERSKTTGATHPPYREAFDPSVAYDGDDLRLELSRILDEVQPTIVALPDPADKHPDHHAASLFAIMAVNDWIARHASGKKPPPRVLAYLVHWPAWPPGWNSPPDPKAEETPLLLPTGLRARDLARTELLLTHAEAQRKDAALARYQTQQREMGPVLGAFVRSTEPFTVLSVPFIRHVSARIEGISPSP